MIGQSAEQMDVRSLKLTLTYKEKVGGKELDSNWRLVFNIIAPEKLEVLIVDGFVPMGLFPEPGIISNVKELEFRNYNAHLEHLSIVSNLRRLRILGSSANDMSNEGIKQLLGMLKGGANDTEHVTIENCRKDIYRFVFERERTFDEILLVDSDGHQITWSSEHGHKRLEVRLDDDFDFDPTILSSFEKAGVEKFELYCNGYQENMIGGLFKFCGRHKLNQWWETIHKFEKSLWALNIRGLRDENVPDTLHSKLQISKEKLPQLMCIVIQIKSTSDNRYPALPLKKI